MTKTLHIPIESAERMLSGRLIRISKTALPEKMKLAKTESARASWIEVENPLGPKAFGIYHQ